MAKSRQILNTIDTESKLEKQRAAQLPKSSPSVEYLERMEEEKYKTESTKTHERYRRKQMAVGGADLTDLIRPAKEIKQKPGTYFYGTLEKLGKDFDNPWGKKAIKSGRIKKVSELLDSSIMPGIQGGPLMHVIAAKAVAFKEALTDDFKSYSQQIVNNAKSMAETMLTMGYDLVSGGTDTHLILIDLTNLDITGKYTPYYFPSRLASDGTIDDVFPPPTGSFLPQGDLFPVFTQASGDKKAFFTDVVVTKNDPRNIHPLA